MVFSGGSDSCSGYRSHGKRWCEPCQEQPLAAQVTCTVAVRLLVSTWLAMHSTSPASASPLASLALTCCPSGCPMNPVSTDPLLPRPSRLYCLRPAGLVASTLHKCVFASYGSCLLLFLSSPSISLFFLLTEFKLLCRQNCCIKTQNTFVKSEYSLNPYQIKLHIIFAQFEIILL